VVAFKGNVYRNALMEFGPANARFEKRSRGG